MFDDLKQEPEDIFEETDKVAPQVTPPTEAPAAPAAPAAQPEQSATPAEATPEAAPAQPSIEQRIAQAQAGGGGVPWKAILLIVGIIVVVGGAIFLSIKILEYQTPTTPAPPEMEEDTTQPEPVVEVEEEVESEEEVVVEEEEPEIEEEPAVSKIDTDKDGLSDSEEVDYGTSPLVADTDSDGLFDLEEVMTWGTDPLDPDTDDDGYLDGEEVSAGYNPNGPGELREQPAQTKE